MRADYDLYVVLIGNSQCISKKQMEKLYGFPADFIDPCKLAFSGELI